MLAVLVASCAEPGPTQATRRTVEERPRKILQSPSFMVDIQEVFARRGCSDQGCHGAGQAGLTLTADVAANYAELVNVPAESEPYLRVEPYDAQNSYVVIKIEGRHLVGSQMPVDLPLDSIDVANIRNWIDNGAPRN